jgi:hypothetical protein
MDMENYKQSTVGPSCTVSAVGRVVNEVVSLTIVYTEKLDHFTFDKAFDELINLTFVNPITVPPEHGTS